MSLFKKKEKEEDKLTVKDKIIIFSMFGVILIVIGIFTYNLFGNLINNESTTTNSPKVKNSNGIIINGEEKAYADDKE